MLLADARGEFNELHDVHYHPPYFAAVSFSRIFEANNVSKTREEEKKRRSRLQSLSSTAQPVLILYR